MINFNEYVKYSVIIYLMVSLYIWIQKPSLFFDNNKIKQFGIGYGKSIFYYPFIMIILAISIYFIFYSIYLRNSLR